MANFLTAQKKAKSLTPQKVSKELFRFIRTIEKEFIDRNIAQIENSEDSTGKLLTNKNKVFSGVYSQTTENIALFENPLAPKKAGEPYNFLYTGEFFKNFELFIANDTLTLFSTGTGSGDKADFFKGYDNLFGLTDEHLNELIGARILPFFITYYRSNLI